MKKIRLTYLIFTLLSGLILLFLVGPLVSLFFSTSPNSLFETSKDSEVVNSIWLTLWTSMAATLVFAIAALPFAYMLARKEFPLKRLVLGVIDLPIVIPHTAAGIALLGSVSRDTWLGKIAGSLGIDFVGHPAGIALAMAFVSLPFLISAARNGFEAVPIKLEQAAMNLGASRWRVFITIAVPISWRSIVSGLVLMFARGMSEFGAVVIIAYHPMVAPILIYERFGSFGLDYARPVSIIFISISLLFFILLRSVSKNKANVKD
jgi:molybdate/tungstate transport system permease protein